MMPVQPESSGTHTTFQGRIRETRGRKCILYLLASRTSERTYYVRTAGSGHNNESAWMSPRGRKLLQHATVIRHSASRTAHSRTIDNTRRAAYYHVVSSSQEKTPFCLTIRLYKDLGE